MTTKTGDNSRVEMVLEAKIATVEVTTTGLNDANVGENLAIDVYNETNMVGTIDKDNSNNPITAKQGQYVQIDAVYVPAEGTITATVTVTGWDGQIVDKEF